MGDEPQPPGEIGAAPDEKRAKVRRVVLALLPLPYLAATAFVATYLMEDHAGAQALVPLSLLGFPVVVIVAGVAGARAPSWSARARLWALTLVCVGLSCAVMNPATRAASALFERRTIRSRAEAMRDHARDPAHRARVAKAEGPLWVVGERDAPTVEGYTFERAAYTPAGAWFLVRPASGIYWGWGIFVPFADVDPALVGVGGPLRPTWVTDLEPAGVAGFFRFRTPDGMSGGGGWTLDRAYRDAR